MSERSIQEGILHRVNRLEGCKFRKLHGTQFGFAGDPDLWGSVYGHLVLIEVKQPGKKPSKIQEVRIREWRATGAVVEVVHSVREGVSLVEHVRETMIASGSLDRMTSGVDPILGGC